MMNQHSQKSEYKEPSDQPLSDDLLLADAAVSGSFEARRQVVERVFDRVWKTLSYVSNCAADVDDLAQNALIEILESLHSYRGDAPLVHWANRIAIRSAARRFEKRKRRTALFSKLFDIISFSTPQSTEPLTEYRAVLERFQGVLARLGEETKMAIILHHIDDYSIEEIADLCGCSPFTIKGRLRRGRRRLRRAVLADPMLAEWVKHELGWREP